MKKLIFIAWALMAVALPFGACSDSNMGDDPEEPFTDPIPLDSLGIDSVWVANPLIFSDVPDPSVIRVGEDYYMVSTSMHLVPGPAILHSTDLVDWKTVGYVFDRLEGTSAADFEYDEALGTDDIYSLGSWASSLAYYNGKFYCLWNKTGFGANAHSYISSTTNPAGSWKVEQELDYYYDASLFFDDDGTAYIIAAHGETITKLNADLSASNTVYKFDTGSYVGEGYQFRKANGKYYLFMMYWPENKFRSVVCLRSDKIEGPYSARMILNSDIQGVGGDGVSQGTIVDTPDGQWYGFFFTDFGSLGRCPVLVPCRWENGWPMLGNKNGVVEAEVPAPVQSNRYSRPSVVYSDEFESSQLDLMWQWNHNPSKNHWTLGGGKLRLTTSHVAKDYFHAKNTLTCRTMGPACSGIIKMDFAKMKDGDYAGLSMMQYQSGLIGVKKEGSVCRLFMSDGQQNGNMTERATANISQTQVYLKVIADFDTNLATFHYSLNGYSWTELGTPMSMTYDMANFVGNRFAIFNYATKQTGGTVEVDYFRFKRM